MRPELLGVVVLGQTLLILWLIGSVALAGVAFGCVMAGVAARCWWQRERVTAEYAALVAQLRAAQGQRAQAAREAATAARSDVRVDEESGAWHGWINLR